MGKPIARRKLLSLLPALALPFSASRLAGAADASGRKHDSSLSLNAADALYQYRILLEKVRGDAFQQAAGSTARAVEACNDTLGQLRDAVTELEKHLHAHPNWPELQKRFSALDESLGLAQGAFPNRENAEAVRALPQTLEALRDLMKEVSSACNDDPDGKAEELVDRVYSRIRDQNNAIGAVDANRGKWAAWNEGISAAHLACGKSMDEAGDAIADGQKNIGGWQARALQALASAIKALNDIQLIVMQMKAAAPEEAMKRAISDESASEAGVTAIEALGMMLEATQTSLSKPEGASAIHASYQAGGGQPSPSQPPSVNLSDSDSGLIAKVQSLVQQNNPKYFESGISTYTINCIAVCWPIWVVYSTDTPQDRQQRERLIASALAFGLIRGTVRNYHSKLIVELQGVYLDTLESRNT
jgi:hypothetical protein